MTSNHQQQAIAHIEQIAAQGGFSRHDDSDDALFYARDRFVQHIDGQALQTIEQVIGTLITERAPRILDLMASWDSHVPASVQPAELTVLGLNEDELQANVAATRVVLHDLNASPELPLDDGHFDVVLNTVSVDYLTRPLEVFREVGRVLAPGGLYLVTFSNRMFADKAVHVWRESGDDVHVLLVQQLFRASGLFEEPRLFASTNRQRPDDDRYAGLGLPSDPVYVVHADRLGGHGAQRPSLAALGSELARAPAGPELGYEEPRDYVRRTHCCPSCGARMRKWLVPQTPFTEWDSEHLYICFNDRCAYYVRSGGVMAGQGNIGVQYRQMYNPDRHTLSPIPVPSPMALREGIVPD